MNTKIVTFVLIIAFIFIIGIASGEDPILIGHFDTPGYAWDVKVSGNYAYIADDTNGLVIVDISDPWTPIQASNYITTGWAHGVAVSGKYAYIADAVDGLVILDISNPTAPTFESKYDTEGNALSVEVSGNYAFIADQSNGLVIVDISNPSAPILVGHYDTAGNAYDVAVSGNYAYVADEQNWLVIVDISDPAAPSLAGHFDIGGWAYGVELSGNYAYVADDANGLVIIDINNPTAPKLTGQYSTMAVNVGVSGNYAYIAAFYNGIVIVDVSDPTAPTFANQYDTAGYTLGIAVLDNYVYLADGTNGFLILQLPSAKTWYVDDGGGPGIDFIKIQDAVNAASSGDTIYVYTGTYNEHIYLDKSLTLIGENNDSTIIDGGRDSDTLSIVTSECQVTGFTIRNATYEGVSLGGNNNIISNNKIIQNEVGIRVSNANHNTIKNNILTLNGYAGIDFHYNCNYNTIIKNTAFNNDYSGLTYNFKVGSGNSILNNKFNSNMGHGIGIYQSEGGDRIESNEIKYNGHSGIRIESSDNFDIIDNVIIENYNWGIYLSNSNGILVYHNNLINNGEHPEIFKNAGDDFGNNQWDNGAEGNYYSDYTGLDVDGDGIGDVPYEMQGSSGAQDRYPLMEPWGFTPSIIANFTANVTSGNSPLTVQFTDTSTGSPTTWEWDVDGDGIVDYTEQNPVHTYTDPGSYNVSLDVSNEYGSDTKAVIDYITIISLQLPDLAISTNNITFSNSIPDVGDIISINATIHNLGDSDANNVIVQFFDGDPVNGIQIESNKTIDLIKAKENETVNITWIAETGTHNIYVKIDPNDGISESNENNNEAHNIISVGCYKDIIAKKILLLGLDGYWNYDFYEQYYNYDDNASAPDPIKEPFDCNIPIEDDDIWITRFSTYSPGFYPSSAALMGPVIGFDTNSWYSWSTPVKGITYPEFEIKGIDGWISAIPMVGEDIKELLEDLLSASEFSIKLDGVYADAPLEWDSSTNRSSIPIKFSGKAIGPGLEEGGECGGTYTKYYDIGNNVFGDDLSDLYCTAGIGISEKSIGYSESTDLDMGGLISFDGKIQLNGTVDPDLDVGVKLKVGEPQALLSAGITDIQAELNAFADGKICTLGSCDNMNLSLPMPTMENIGLLGEVIVPINEFESGDYVEAIFLNPSGKNVRYEDLDEMSPVIRMATSNITISYKVDINLSDFGFACDEQNICYPICANGICFNVCTGLSDFGLGSDCIFNAYDGTLNIESIDDLKWGVCKLVIYSPVDVHIYDTMGRHIGPNATGGIELEIPYSTYIFNDRMKIVTFPTTTDKFILVLNGTDIGTYNMTIHRPIFISDANTDIIKGITYSVNDVPTDVGNIDYYNINFEDIERLVNEKVGSGESINNAVNESFDSIITEKNIIKLPTSLFISDIFGANGDQVILRAKLMSLDRPLDNKTITFKVDDIVVGQAVTGIDGNGTMNYIIPDSTTIGTHQISAIFSGDDTYYETKGDALLNVLNQPPEVEMDLPNFILHGNFLIEGEITDLNLEQVILEIDNVIVANSIPYLWDTTKYTDGLHFIKLTAQDIYGEKDQFIAFVIIDNTPPTVIDYLPIGTDIPVITEINVTFSETMNQSSVQDAFIINPTTTGLFSWSGNTMIFTPTHLLQDSTYEISIGTDAKDLAGNHLLSSYRWNFTTEVASIPAIIDFNPDTLNLKSKGKWVTVYIELPEDDVNNINISTLTLNDLVQAEDNPIGIGDYNNDGIADLMVKFNMSAVQKIFEVGDESVITITGKLSKGIPFEGADTIRVKE